MTSAVDINQVRKSFGAIDALRGMTFSVPEGQRVALLGPNGAGKTTLVRCLCGRTKLNSGSIDLFGAPATDATIATTIGLVPQEIALYGDLTTRENLWAFGRFSGLKRNELRHRVDWALAWTGLEDRAGDLVGTFSGGMQRRVNLACGVMHRPRVLLLDEPTVGVDPQSRQRIFEMLDELNQLGTTILLTTHHLDEAQQRSDRIVIVDKGQVIADGTLDELIDKTVGSQRMVSLRIDRPLSQPIMSHAAGKHPLGRTGQQVVSTRIQNASHELPMLLDAARQSGYEVSDVQVHSPTLHHVFLHLTGHELRD